MAEGKKIVNIYTEWIEIFEALNDENAGKLIKHFFRYVNDLDHELNNELLNMAFIPIKQQLKRDLKKWESMCYKNKQNGLKGGRPNKPKKPTGFLENPNKPKKADKDKDEDKDKDKDINTSVKNKFLPERDLLNSVINYFDLDIISNLTKADSEKWLDAIHKLHKIDNYSFEKIKEVIIFGRTDDFWSKNFLSVAGLRKKKNGITKFQQILKNYEHGKNTKSNSKNQRTEKLRVVMQSIADDPDLL